MAAGLQCPGCGHVHPAALPEIARGDSTFRCYGCYRALSVPEGWSARPAARPPSRAADPSRAGRAARPDHPSWPDEDTRLLPGLAPDPLGAPPDPPPPGPPGGPPGRGRDGSGVPTVVRMIVWAGAFTGGLAVSAVILRQTGFLDVNTALDFFAGSGAGRFGVLAVALPLWSVISAVIAHLGLERLARRRLRSRPGGPAPEGPMPDQSGPENLGREHPAPEHTAEPSAT